MALIGKAAMILSFDIESAAINEHDNWHNHEHLPERLSVPGFRRGSRWVALSGSPRYFVMYEVDDLATLASPRYLERLNNPTPWTARRCWKSGVLAQITHGSTAKTSPYTPTLRASSSSAWGSVMDFSAADAA